MGISEASALLTTTMMNFKVVIGDIDTLERADKRAPKSKSWSAAHAYADSVGADGYAEDASSAVRKARELLAAGAKRACPPKNGDLPALPLVLPRGFS